MSYSQLSHALLGKGAVFVEPARLPLDRDVLNARLDYLTGKLAIQRSERYAEAYNQELTDQRNVNG